MLKATNVDGVYDDDPKLNPNAHLLDTLSYHDVTTKDLSVMDMTAVTLCQENKIPGIYWLRAFLFFHLVSSMECIWTAYQPYLCSCCV